MLIHPTVERLRALGLSAMADAFIELHNAPDAAELTREDWLGLLVDREATSRENKRLARRLREAKLRQAAIVEDVNLHAPRGLDRALFQKTRYLGSGIDGGRRCGILGSDRALRRDHEVFQGAAAAKALARGMTPISIMRPPQHGQRSSERPVSCS
jgi:hypothetical protein